MSHKKQSLPDSLVGRLVELTFVPMARITDWLDRIGLEIVRCEAGVTTVKNPYLNLTTALTIGSDPITQAVCLGFATAGVYWPQLYPGLLETVNREWKHRNASASQSDAVNAKAEPRQHRADRPVSTTPPTFETLYRQRRPHECRR